MLVLSRKRDQDIVIGNDLIRIRIVAIRGDKVRVGIIADKTTSVHRAEVFEAIQRQGGVDRKKPA